MVHEYSDRPSLVGGLTDPTALLQWLGTFTEGTFVNGGSVTIQHAENYSCTSQILTCEPERLLAMTWQFSDEELSNLQIEITRVDDAIDLVLTHDSLGDEAENYLTGWHTHFLYLEDLLMGRPRPMDEFWSTYELLSGQDFGS